MISENMIMSNTAAANGGGGLYLTGGQPLLTGNTILSNTAEDGGGIGLYQCDATLLGNTVVDNRAQGVGGGLSLYYSDSMLDGNAVLSNTASGGGGLFVRRSSPILTNTVVANNRATGSGGGLSITDGSSPRLLHTTLSSNMAGSAGSGMYVYVFATYTCTVSMTNTIVANHWTGIYVASGNVARLEGTLWYSNTADCYGPGQFVTGTLNYWGDPRFAADGYHLLTGSAAIDRGVNAGVTTDIDGEARTGIPDLGADEVLAPVPLASVSITGPVTGAVNTSYAFEATVSPLNATQPITYVWQATGQSAVTHTGRGIADSVNFTWSMTGTQAITVTASNALNTVSDNYLVNVIRQYCIYLPVVLRD
jgi:parallel beta-helix repeat protein